MEKAKTKQLKPEESAGSLAAEPRGDGESARVGAVGRPLGVSFFYFLFCLFVLSLCCFCKLCFAFHLVLKQTKPCTITSVCPDPKRRVFLLEQSICYFHARIGVTELAFSPEPR